MAVQEHTDVKKALADLRAYWKTGATRSYEAREEALKKLYEGITRNEDKIFEAVHADLGKAAFETYMTEVGLVLDQIRYTRRHLREWMSPKRVPVGIAQFAAESHVVREPFGVVLIMSPWNYPFQLTMEPLVGAIAGGNTVMVQPSDYSPNTSRCMAEIVDEIFDPEYCTVILGGHKGNPDLLDYHYDSIFFTGSTRVGKIVLQAAANYCTPVILELGGMSPCIVDETANMELAGKRIMFGKVLNSGQTCVAPDYVYVHESKREELIEAMCKALDEFFPNGALNDETYPHMINQKAYDKVTGLMKDQTIARGGQVKPETLQIEPTLLIDVTWDSPSMSEEMFGPVLPILTYTDLDEILETINSKPRPLSCYVFTEKKEIEEKIISELSFGNSCINDTVVQVGAAELPFGGVGASGMGRYHGKYSFDTFTYAKSIMNKATWVDIKEPYHPYTEKNFKVLRKVLH